LFMLYPSIKEAVMAIYPEFDWDVAKFPQITPPNQWRRLDHQRQFLDSIKNQLGVTEVRENRYGQSHF